MSDHEDETITKENTPPKVVPHITTVTNVSTKFPYLKKGDAKSMTTDKDGNLKIRPSVTAEKHQQNAIKARFGGNAESKKMQKSLLKQKFKEFKISKEEGLDKGYDKMQKILTQMNTLKIKPEPKDVNMKFLRGLPPSWSGIALILKTKGGLEYILFNDLYNKLKFLEIDTKGYLSSSFTLSNAAFVSTANQVKAISLTKNQEMVAIPPLSLSLLVLYLLRDPQNLNAMNKEEFKEYDLKHRMAMLSIKDKQTEEGNTEPRSLENFGMVAGIKIASDVDSKGEVVSTDNAIPASVSVSAGDVAAVVVRPQSEIEFALMGLSTKKLID
nr:ribonuclease H-like domain-containing protein [Tanacetum cinerariifolium]